MFCTYGTTASSRRTIWINLCGTSPTYISTYPKWNHLPQSFASGFITPKGDSSGDTLTFLRTTNGYSSGMRVFIQGVSFTGENNGQNSAGYFPATVNISEWTQPGSAGNARSFFISGLTANMTYYANLVCSSSSLIGGNDHGTYRVTGSTGTGANFVDVDIKGNVNSLLQTNVKPDGSNRFTVTLTVVASAGSPRISAIELVY